MARVGILQIPKPAVQSTSLVQRILLDSLPRVEHVLKESWSVSERDLYAGVDIYAGALIASVEQHCFDPLEHYLSSLDALWRAEQFTLEPLIRSMFIIQDVAQSHAAESELPEARDLIEEYTRRAIAFLTQRSVSLVMRRLEDQVERHREGEARLMSLQRVGSALVSDLNPDGSLELIADEARKLIGADGVVIRLSNDKDELRFVAGTGDDRQILRDKNLPIGESLSGAALRSGRPMLVDDIREDARVNPEFLNVSGGGSLLIVPMNFRDQPIGVITGTAITPATFDDQDISILSLFADQAASAIENGRLFRQAQDQIAELEALHRVSQLVSSSLDLEEIFQTLYEEVARLMPADAFLVALARPDGLHDFEFIVDDGQRFPPRRGLELSAILADGLHDGGMVVLRDVTQHPQYARANRFGKPGRQTRSVLAAPLMRGDQVIGMISAQSYSEHDYRDPESRMLRTIASQAAIAIEHARLYRQAQNVAIAEERARLAREIHDTLAQGLIGVILCLERLDLTVPDDDEHYRPWVERSLELSRSSLEEARRSVRDLRAAPLEGRTLLEALANLVADVAEDSEFEVTTNLATQLPSLSARVETALFRIAQEAISNARKHADCQSLDVQLTIEDNSLTLRISDDGVGFAVDDDALSPEHFGLMTMRERVLQIGGVIDIASTRTNGTTVRVTIPVNTATHQEFTEDTGNTHNG